MDKVVATALPPARLARPGGGVGVATLCIGVGQGRALVLER
ncbi:hypothetical protein GCM10022232_21330 [Streptomyces plumbiresistens]|uniref:Thiolase C-terminal domain-containing protein n=1 Tax=Streptomyces plumbiresistens TaxID=511811 RepID=A0ABP7QT73_9ACTN